MKTFAKPLGLMVLMLAVIGYTIYNYTTGKTDFTMFLVSMGILCVPLVNMIRLLIQEMKKR